MFSNFLHLKPIHFRFPLSSLSILENKFDSCTFALYVRQKKLTFEIQILHTAKFSLHIPISLLSVENWEAETRITDGVRFFMCDS